MPLSPQEQQELQQLEAEVGNANSPQDSFISRLGNLLSGAYKGMQDAGQQSRNAFQQSAKDVTAQLRSGQPVHSTPAQEKMSQDILSGIAGASMGGTTKGLVNELPGEAPSISGAIMNRAVGLKDTPSTVGQKLVDMGVGGGKDKMLSQMGNKLDEQEGVLQSLVKGTPKDVDISSLPQAINNVGKQFQTDSGATGIGMAPQLKRVQELANEAQAHSLLGNLPASEALDQMRILGQKGYAEGEALPSTVASAARAGREELRNILTKAYPGQLDEALSNQSALIKGSKALQDKPSGLQLSDMLMGGGGAGLGAAMGKPLQGAMIGGALSGARAASQSPTLMSGLAHGVNLGDRAVSGAANILNNPTTRALGTLGSQSNSPAPMSEEEERQLLEQEVGHLLK